MIFFKSILCAIILCGLTLGDHGASVFSKLMYPANFTQFHFTPTFSPPQDGKIIWGSTLNFNNLNPFSVRGQSSFIVKLLCYARLLDDSYDELGTSYAYLAENVETSPDYTWVKFKIRNNATFSDGSPITTDDVAFSFNMLCEHNPNIKNYYRYVDRVEVIDPHTLIFHCPHNKSHEIATALGQISIVSKAFFKDRDPGALLTQPIPSSGPYEIESVDIGNYIQLKRRPHWWGKMIPSQVGKYNLDTLRILIFHDTSAMMQAFLSGEIDLCFETRIKVWEETYKGHYFDTGRICRSELEHKDCGYTYGMFFNMRKFLFNDQRVRKAIKLMINGPWLNTNLYKNRYKRSQSYFPNSVLAHQALPEGEEQQTLKLFQKQLPESIWTQSPACEEVYHIEERRQQALMLLEEAGWKLTKGKLKKGNNFFTFTILITSPTLEKLTMHVKNVLKPLGIEVAIRTLDRVVYQEKLDKLDYDMVVEMIPQSLLPGSEQMSYWGSTSANTFGTKNYAGIQNPVVDELCNRLLTAKNYEQLCMYTRALDRVLINGDYMIPCWYFDRLLVAHKPRIRWMTTHSPHQTMRWLFETMWVEEKNQTETKLEPLSLMQKIKRFLCKKMISNHM